MAIKSPYDPVKSLEGMFNGSLVRIAYALKDPASFAGSTKDVLAETAKRFQDALDDCEIQILDAKWYLENQLAQNKARRETKAKEESVLNAKRKHEQMVNAGADSTEKNESEQPNKRIKTAEDQKQSVATSKEAMGDGEKAGTISQAERKESGTKADQQPRKQQQQSSPSKPTTKPPDTDSPTQTQKQPPSKPSAPGQTVTSTKPQSQPRPASKPSKAKIPQEPAATKEDDTAKDEFNFESMFDEDPSSNLDNGNDPDNADLPFDLDLEDAFGDPINTVHPPTTNSGVNHTNNDDLSSLLPGLETYANQANDDPPSNFHMDLNPQTDNQNSSTAQIPSNGNSNHNNPFDPSNLATNDFDDFFNNSLGDLGDFGNNTTAGGGSGMNFDTGNQNSGAGGFVMGLLDPSDFGGGGGEGADNDNIMGLDSMDMEDFDSMFN